MRLLLFILLALPSLSIAQTAVPVTVQPLGELLVERELRAPAEVLSANRATIGAEVPAVIESIKTDVGQVVAKGEVLLALDATDYELALSQARANLASNMARIGQAEIRLKRARDLSGNQYISADDLLARETDVVVLKAEQRALEVAVASAKREVAKCTIKAPFAGVVTERMGQAGSFVARGTPLLMFVETERVEVDAEIAAHLAGSLERAGTMRFVANGSSWPLQLARLSPIIESALRAQRGRFVFSDQAAPIGASGELVWSISGGLLPADLVVSRDGQFGVFVANGESARFVQLANAQEGRPVPVSLPTDTPIIVGGREKLQDGVGIVRGEE